MNTTDDTTPEARAKAWAWIAQHERVLRATMRRALASVPLDREDFRHELLADLVRTFGQYDPARSGPYTWISMRAAYVRRTMVRASWRYVVTGSADADAATGADRPADQWGHPARVEALALASAALRRADDDARRAAWTVVLDYDTEALARLGWSRRQRDRLVATIDA